SARQSTVSHWHRGDPRRARTNKAEPEVLFFFFRVQRASHHSKHRSHADRQPPPSPHPPRRVSPPNPAEHQIPDDTHPPAAKYTMSDDRVSRTSDKEITRMWRVYRTVMEMVYDRVQAPSSGV